jgi:hypothetical protein
MKRSGCGPIGTAVTVGNLLLLLLGIIQHATEQGREWFCVQHQACTVFDVDAQVAATTSACVQSFLAAWSRTSRALESLTRCIEAIDRSAAQDQLLRVE